jgi:hypothetical protein
MSALRLRRSFDQTQHDKQDKRSKNQKTEAIPPSKSGSLEENPVTDPPSAKHDQVSSDGETRLLPLILVLERRYLVKVGNLSELLA